MCSLLVNVAHWAVILLYGLLPSGLRKRIVLQRLNGIEATKVVGFRLFVLLFLHRLEQDRVLLSARANLIDLDKRQQTSCFKCLRKKLSTYLVEPPAIFDNRRWYELVVVPLVGLAGLPEACSQTVAAFDPTIAHIDRMLQAFFHVAEIVLKHFKLCQFVQKWF